MRRLTVLIILLLLLLFSLSGCYSCQSWHSFWGTGPVEPLGAEKFFWDADCKPVEMTKTTQPQL